MKVIFIRGISGAGKSSIARGLQTYYRASGFTCEVIEADAYFEDEHGYDFQGTKIGKAHDEARARMVQSALTNDYTIVANTFTQLWELLGDDPKSPGYLYHLRKTVSSPNLKEAIIRIMANEEAAANRNVHNVPKEIIQKQARRYVPYHSEHEITLGEKRVSEIIAGGVTEAIEKEIVCFSC